MVKVYITKCVLSFILMIEVASKIIFHNNDFKLIRTLIDTKKKTKTWHVHEFYNQTIWMNSNNQIWNLTIYVCMGEMGRDIR